ncbi:hypothetical protein LguiB_010583 [Lonicera macranthoides]
MRTGLSTIQQTLTPEAASVLNHSIAEAARRNHGQTTPLHVAATLLASPSGYMRHACIRSHPNSSHPLQCRALELCFSVALERLPTTQSTTDPPVSNALMAALKRAQAHQRRGSPEQQQQPLLAVKVELQQLIISILDDPSVSRVMREASFSSPAVKAMIENGFNSNQSPSGLSNPAMIGGFRPVSAPLPVPVPNRNLYLNPRLQQGNLGLNPNSNLNLTQLGNHRDDEVKRVLDIFLRMKKRNPVLVGDSEPESVIKEVFRRIENGGFSEGRLKNVEVVSIEKDLESFKNQIPTKIKDLIGLIDGRIGNGGGVILDLGDLKWLVEQPAGSGGGGPPQASAEMGREAVAEMGKLLARFAEGGGGGGGNGRIWLIGTATCETYLRCQVYHPSMENEWDLQAVPVASRSPLQGMFSSNCLSSSNSRPGPNGILNSSIESLNPLKNLSTATNALARKATFCPQCSQNYRQELAKLVANDSDILSSEVKIETAKPPLPQWLQNTKLNIADAKTINQSQGKDQEMVVKEKTQELQKKWSETCLHLHPTYHNNLGSDRISPMALSLTSLYNPNLIPCHNVQPKLQQTKNLQETLETNPNQGSVYPTEERPSGPPASPVRTDLVLGPTTVTETAPKESNDERVKDFLGCISSKPKGKFDQLLSDKFANALDTESFKKLLKGLMEKAWWQPEASAALATTVMQCKTGNGKQRGPGSKGNMWLLFAGPDRIGKKKMARVISEHVCGTGPTMICLGSRRDDEEMSASFRGKTALDRIAEAVRRNPFSVIMLQDIDEADMLVRGSVKRAMERGRLTDSYGREISLGSVIFILTGNWSVAEKNGGFVDETKLKSLASGSWQLKLTVSEKSSKRRANWLSDQERPTRHRRELGSSICLDLNLSAVEAKEDRTDGSHNSSDLTVDHEDLENGGKIAPIMSVPRELVDCVDGVIVFKQVDRAQVCREIEKTIAKMFSAVVDDRIPVEVEEEVVERIHGGVWFGRTSLQEWAERVLGPAFRQLRSNLGSAGLDRCYESWEVRLAPEVDSGERSDGEWLPSKISVMADGV